MNRLVLAAAIFLTAPAARADGISLDDALRRAMAENPLLARAVVDVDVADARVVSASGLDDFVVGAGTTWQRARGQNASGQATPLLPYDAVDANLTLTRPFATGGSVGVKLDAPWARLGAEAGGTVDVYQPTASIVFTHPLLRGRGFDVARADLRRARAAHDVATLDLATSATALARDAARAYWELAFAEGNLALRRESLDAARAQLDAVKAQIDVGKQPPSASAEVEVSVLLREDEVIDAEGALDARATDLGRFFGLAKGPSLRARERAPLVGAPDGDVVQRALDENPEIAGLTARAAAARIEVDVAESALLPQLDLTLQAGPAGIGSDLTPALRSLASFSGYGASIGLTFQEPIERRAARGARDAAADLVARARLTLADTRAKVAADTENALTALEASRRRALLLDHAVSVAELDLASETARFQANRSTSFDVLRRQQALTDARLRLLRATVDDTEARVALDALTGELLARHGLAVRRGR